MYEMRRPRLSDLFLHCAIKKGMLSVLVASIFLGSFWSGVGQAGAGTHWKLIVLTQSPTYNLLVVYKSLIESEPNHFYAFALPRKTRTKLPVDLHSIIENPGIISLDKSGVLERHDGVELRYRLDAIKGESLVLYLFATNKKIQSLTKAEITPRLIIDDRGASIYDGPLDDPVYNSPIVCKLPSKGMEICAYALNP